MKTLKVSSDLSELDSLRNFFKESLEEQDIPEEVYFMIELALLEICINIMRYAYPEEKGDIVLKSWLNKKRIYFEIQDDGIPFDPSKMKKPNIKKNIKEQKTGGLGIHLSRELMDGFDYKRIKGKNILRVHKQILS